MNDWLLTIWVRMICRVSADERGMEVPSAIMLLSMVTIPLIMILVSFADQITDMLKDAVERLRPDL